MSNKQEELRSKISDNLANLMVKASLQKLDSGDILASGRKFIEMHNEELSDILLLINQEVYSVLSELKTIWGKDKSLAHHAVAPGEEVLLDAIEEIEKRYE